MLLPFFAWISATAERIRAERDSTKMKDEQCRQLCYSTYLGWLLPSQAHEGKETVSIIAQIMSLSMSYVRAVNG